MSTRLNNLRLNFNDLTDTRILEISSGGAFFFFFYVFALH